MRHLYFYRFLPFFSTNEGELHRLNRPEHPCQTLTQNVIRKTEEKGQLHWEARWERGDFLPPGKKVLDSAVTVQHFQGSFSLSSSAEDRATGPDSSNPAPPPHLLFSRPFRSCHSKCYSQLVKVHYTLSSWPEIYAPQRLHRAREGCNPLRLMTVHVSRQEAWIFLTRLNVD